jgi:hypothetical protein
MIQLKKFLLELYKLVGFSRAVRSWAARTLLFWAHFYPKNWALRALPTILKVLSQKITIAIIVRRTMARQVQKGEAQLRWEGLLAIRGEGGSSCENTVRGERRGDKE